MTDKNENAKKQDNKRAYDWTFIVYPESAPEDWRKVLIEKFAFKGFISPLHDKDVLDDVEQTPKKAHYHVIARFASKKSFAQVKEITDYLNQPIPQPIKSIEGAVRYLVHIDSPDKYQYNQDEIECVGNVDKSRYFTMSKDDKVALMIEIMDFISEKNIIEICHLIDYAREMRFDWFKYLAENAYLIDKYITSRRNKLQQKDMSLSVDVLANALRDVFKK